MSISSSWMKEYVILPFSITSILSAAIIVEILWAITMLVLPDITKLKADCIRFSDIESSEEVASSRISMRRFLRITRAIEILCFSPPESLRPLLPTTVLSLSGKLSIKS